MTRASLSAVRDPRPAGPQPAVRWSAARGPLVRSPRSAGPQPAVRWSGAGV